MFGLCTLGSIPVMNGKVSDVRAGLVDASSGLRTIVSGERGRATLKLFTVVMLGLALANCGFPGSHCKRSIRNTALHPAPP